MYHIHPDQLDGPIDLPPTVVPDAYSETTTGSVGARREQVVDLSDGREDLAAPSSLPVDSRGAR